MTALLVVLLVAATAAWLNARARCRELERDADQLRDGLDAWLHDQRQTETQ